MDGSPLPGAVRTSGDVPRGLGVKDRIGEFAVLLVLLALLGLLELLVLLDLQELQDLLVLLVLLARQ